MCGRPYLPPTANAEHMVTMQSGPIRYTGPITQPPEAQPHERHEFQGQLNLSYCSGNWIPQTSQYE